MNILSLFDGISCGRIALSRANIPVTTYFASEINTNAIKVSQHNWPDIVQLGSVTTVTKDRVGDVDLLIGGSPCQDLSCGGKRTNYLNGARSSLFWEYVRIKNECNPTWFLLENVKTKKDVQDQISEAIGVDPICIDSALFSAQTRKRLYWTNIPVNMDIPDTGVFIRDVIDLNNKTLRRNGLTYLPSALASTMRLDLSRNQCNVGSRNPKFNRVSQSNQVHHRKMGALCKHGDNRDWIYTPETGVRELTIEECEIMQTLPVGYTSCLSNINRRRELIGDGWTVDVIAYILAHI